MPELVRVAGGLVCWDAGRNACAAEAVRAARVSGQHRAREEARIQVDYPLCLLNERVIVSCAIAATGGVMRGRQARSTRKRGSCPPCLCLTSTRTSWYTTKHATIQ